MLSLLALFLFFRPKERYTFFYFFLDGFFFSCYHCIVQQRKDTPTFLPAKNIPSLMYSLTRSLDTVRKASETHRKRRPDARRSSSEKILFSSLRSEPRKLTHKTTLYFIRLTLFYFLFMRFFFDNIETAKLALIAMNLSDIVFDPIEKKYIVF